MEWGQGTFFCYQEQAKIKNLKELYQTPAKHLDAWIELCLMPNGEFNDRVAKAVNTITDVVKNNHVDKVHKVVKGGSSGKGTSMKDASDADIVVFLDCFETLGDQRKVRGKVLSDIRDLLNKHQETYRYQIEFEDRVVSMDSKGQPRLPRSLSASIRTQEMEKAIDVDILLAYDILGQVSDGKPDPDIYIKLIEAEGGPGDFSPCFTELQRNFVKWRPAKVKSLIRLVKQWYKTYVKEKYKGIPLPHKYALELLTIYAWERGSREEGFEMSEGFCTVMHLLCQYKGLCIYWTKYYDFENQVVGNYVRHQLRETRPVILDPADPTGIVGQSTNWDLVAAEAKQCLDSECCKNGLSPIQPWDVPLECRPPPTQSSWSYCTIL